MKLALWCICLSINVVTCYAQWGNQINPSPWNIDYNALPYFKTLEATNKLEFKITQAPKKNNSIYKSTITPLGNFWQLQFDIQVNTTLSKTVVPPYQVFPLSASNNTLPFLDGDIRKQNFFGLCMHNKSLDTHTYCIMPLYYFNGKSLLPKDCNILLNYNRPYTVRLSQHDKIIEIYISTKDKVIESFFLPIENSISDIQYIKAGFTKMLSVPVNDITISNYTIKLLDPTTYERIIPIASNVFLPIGNGQKKYTYAVLPEKNIKHIWHLPESIAYSKQTEDLIDITNWGTYTAEHDVYATIESITPYGSYFTKVKLIPYEQNEYEQAKSILKGLFKKKKK